MEVKNPIREVWKHNVVQEFALISRVVRYYPFISLDTEFPGCIKKTHRTATEKDHYEALKFNVDSLKLIQVGLSLSDGYGNLPSFGGVWQFNLRDFNPLSDLHSSESIQLLRKNGINLEKNAVIGIDSKFFATMLLKTLLIGNRNICWVTFHGCYDFAYLVKLLSGKPLPDSQSQFLKLLGCYFVSFYDLKLIAKYSEGFEGGKLGLKRLAEILEVERVGTSHQAGSDSLLTTSVFGKMRERLEKKGFCMPCGTSCFQGYLYGMENYN